MNASGGTVRVMIVVARLGVSGVTTTLIETAQLLGEVDGVEPILVHGSVSRGERDVAARADGAGVRRLHVAPLGREISPVRDVRALWQVWRLIRRHRPDVVHTHTSKAGIVGRLAAFLARVPVVVHTYHGHTFSDYFGRLRAGLFLRLERLAARVTDRIVTESEALRTELVDLHRVAPRERIDVIPVGLRLRPLAEAPRHHGRVRSQLGIGAGVPIVAIMGRLVPIKNHVLFVEVAGLVHDRRPEVRFVVTGDGETRRATEAEIASRGLEDVVTMTGWLDDPVAAITDFDLVALSSDQEGTPVALLEAIAAGVPVVATDVGGVRDVLGPDLLGQMVPPRDPEALAAAIMRTLDDPPDDAAARQRVLATHDISASITAHLDLYRDLLAGDRGRRLV